MKTILLLGFFLFNAPLFAQAVIEANRAHHGGPTAGDTQRVSGRSPHDLLHRMFRAMETHWFVDGYSNAGKLSFRANVAADLPLSTVDNRIKSHETMDFDLNVEGVAAPNGQHRFKIEGGLGRVELIGNLTRNFMASPSFKAFSDTPKRDRVENANLTNYRSYILRHVNRLKDNMLTSGAYRSIYIGTSSWEGNRVDIVRVYKPNLKRKRSKGKRPIPLRKLWTFWHEGGYELWLDTKTHLPRVVFYTNTEDNIYVNFQIDYNQDMRPRRFSYINNSLKSEGSGDLLLTYNKANLLNGFSLSFNGNRGMSLRLDGTLEFGNTPDKDTFRVIPPFGFKKMNRDHLKLMVLTELSGGLLKLKKHGVNFKNFKF